MNAPLMDLSDRHDEFLHHPFFEAFADAMLGLNQKLHQNISIFGGVLDWVDWMEEV